MDEQSPYGVEMRRSAVLGGEAYTVARAMMIQGYFATETLEGCENPRATCIIAGLMVAILLSNSELTGEQIDNFAQDLAGRLGLLIAPNGPTV